MSGTTTAVTVIDATPGQPHSVSRLLASQNRVSVNTVPTVDCALSLHRVDVVVIDLGSRSSEGIDGLKRLRASLHDSTSIVALIGENDTSLRLAAIRARAQDCVIRDTLDAPALVQVLEHSIEKHRLQNSMRAMIDASSDAMLVVDAAGMIVHANNASARLLMQTEADLCGSCFGIPLAGSDAVDVQLCDDQHAQMHVVSVQWRGEKAALLTLRDITERKAREKEVWAQVNFDSLTQLPNRALFIDRLDTALSVGRRGGQSQGLLFIDLDRLKWVNDTYGHACGDELLKTTARRLQSCVRESDTVARLAGDEFVILLSNITGNQGTERVARKVVAELARPILCSDGREFNVTASVGVARSPDHATDVFGLLNCADTAMYQAKAQGRNGYVMYSREIHENVLDNMTLEQDLRYALKHDQISVFYQPVVDLKSGAITDVEALLRWFHPTRGLLDTNTVVEIASHSRLLADLDDRVLRECVLQARIWKHTLFSPPRIWVNLASDRRLDISFDEVIDNLLNEQGFEHTESPIGVEMTEHCRIDESPETLALLNRMRSQGVKLAVDDFLASTSSIRHLKNLPIDVVKIDRDAIRSIALDRNERGFVRSVIDMAHQLNLRTVAEGVETSEQMRILHNAGCDAGQGFHFSRAIPADEMQRLLERPDAMRSRVFSA